jgi:gluconokinase
LKPIYREWLTTLLSRYAIVHMQGDANVLCERLQARSGHFVGPALLASQFATLDAPAPGNGVLAVSCTESTEVQLDHVRAWLMKEYAI